MQAIFSPAIALLNRLNYSRKFTLLWLMSLIAIAVVVYSLFVSLEGIIQPSQRQLQGITLIEPISQTIQATQLHRVISVMLLSGNKMLQNRRAAQEEKVTAALKVMEEKLPFDLTSSENFQNIKTNWDLLRQEQRVEENFAAHTRLIEQLQSFEAHVADEYLLTLDSELASFYLIDTTVNKLPHTLEHLGQLRAYSTGILFNKHISEQQKIQLHILIAKLETALGSLKSNIDKVGHYNPAVRDSLQSALNDIIRSSRQIIDLVTSDILSEHLTAHHEAFLELATKAIDKSYAQMHDTLLPTANTLIQSRIDQAKNTLYTNVGISLLVFLLVVYLSVSIYYAITGHVRSLVHSLRSFTDGNLHVRAQLNTRDELSQVSDSFNEMAHQFSALLETQHEGEVRLRTTFETAMDAVVQMNGTGIIIGWNSQAEKIFGWNCKEAIGRILSETIIPPHYREAHTQGLKHFLLSGEGPALNSRIEVAGLHRDGHEFPVELSIAPIKVAGQTAGKYEFSAFIRDITERKQHEEQLQTASSELLKANAQIEEERAHLAERVMERTAQLLYANLAKDSFLATMSHEIRTPLGGLLGMLELVSLSRLDNEQREMLRAARDSGKSLLRIVNDILDWSKIEAGKLELAPQAAAISEMLKGVVSTYSSLASEKSLLLRVQVDSELGVAHIFDPLRVSQILNNFTSNAIKFTEQGTIEISAKLIARHDGTEQVCFCVKDSGVGISPEQQAHLFQYYEQASADTARMYGGTGLGLVICRSLGDLMEGSISVESALEVGSKFCFTINLPLASPAAQRDLLLRQAREENHDGTPVITPLVEDGKRVSVLVVDDHPANRKLLKQQLMQLGLHTEDAATGITALSLWQAGHFDLIITDCHMPEMDGYELTRSIREIEQIDGRQRMPVIAWTANVLAQEEERCHAAGMDDVLTKPTDLADLRVTLLKWLDKANLSIVKTPRPEMTQDSLLDIPPVELIDAAPVNMPIDFSALKKIAMSHAAQVEMLQEFNLCNRSDIADLKAALKGGDSVDVSRFAHRIKGASRMVGATELESICAAIEQAAKQSDLNGARAMAEASLDKAVERIGAAIGVFITEYHLHAKRGEGARD